MPDAEAQAGPIRYPPTSNVAYTKSQAPLVYSHPDNETLSDQDDDDEYIDINPSEVESNPGDSDDDFMLDPPLLRMRQRIDNLVSHLQREQERARLSEDRVAQLESRLGPLQKAHAAEQVKVKTAEKLAYTAMEQAAASDKCAHEAQSKRVECEGLLVQRNNSIEALRRREKELNAQLEKQAVVSTTLRTQLGEERAAAHAAEARHQDLLKASQNEAEKKIKSLNNRKEDAEVNVRRLTLVVEDLRKQAESATAELNAERQRVHQLEESSGELRHKSTELEGRIIGLNCQIEALHTEKDQAKLKAKSSCAEVIKLRQELETAKFSIASETTRSQVSGCKLQESERRAESLERNLKGSQDKLKDMEQTVKILERQASNAKESRRQQEEADGKIAKLMAEIEELKLKIQSTEITLRQSQASGEENRKKAYALEQRALGVEGMVSVLQGRIKTSEKKASDAEEKVTKYFSQLLTAEDKTETIEMEIKQAVELKNNALRRLGEKTEEGLRSVAQHRQELEAHHCSCVKCAHCNKCWKDLPKHQVGHTSDGIVVYTRFCKGLTCSR